MATADMTAKAPEPGIVLACGCKAFATAQGIGVHAQCQPHKNQPKALALQVAQSQGLKAKLKPRDMPSTPAAAAPVANPALAFTYSGDPSASLNDQVRFRLGDTNAKVPLLTDGEVSYLLTSNNNNAISAAIAGCTQIAAKLSVRCNETVGSVSIAFGQQAKAYMSLQATLKRDVALSARPYAGGISKQDKFSQRTNHDRVKPSFTRDMMQWPDNPERRSWYGYPGYAVAGTYFFEFCE